MGKILLRNQVKLISGWKLNLAEKIKTVTKSLIKANLISLDRISLLQF